MYYYNNRNISYSVNGHHHYRIPVRANVVEMSVLLSTNELVLTEPLISPINFGKTLSYNYTTKPFLVSINNYKTTVTISFYQVLFDTIGFYGSIKMTNKYEVPASFSWKPSEDDAREKAAFYPQHSSGNK